MAGRQHTYRTTLEWIGNKGTGTSDYGAYARDHTIRAGSKPALPGSSDPAFRGDAARWNPEELLCRRAVGLPSAILPASVRDTWDRGDGL